MDPTSDQYPQIRECMEHLEPSEPEFEEKKIDQQFERETAE